MAEQLAVCDPADSHAPFFPVISNHAIAEQLAEYDQVDTLSPTSTTVNIG